MYTKSRSGRRIAALAGTAALGGALLAAGLTAAPAYADTAPATNGGTAVTGVQAVSAGSAYDPTSDPASMYNLTRALQARAAWTRGWTGKGVGVAVLDTGISPVAGLNGTGKVVLGADLSSTGGTTAQGRDDYGHGTQLASIIGGRDAAPTYDVAATSYLGIAPDVTLYNVKVAEADGTTDVTRVISGLAWVVLHQKDNAAAPIRVVNLSYGTDAVQPWQVDPLTYAVDQAWKAGILVVASGGNQGQSAGRLTDPAYDPHLLAVAAADTRSDCGSAATVAPFSNWGDGTRNPDVTAPGVMVQGLRVPGSTIDRSLATAAGTGARYLKGSGTSQAAAVTSGLAALLLQKNPTWTPSQVKVDLVSSATPMTGSRDVRSAGSGLVNAEKALNTTTGPVAPPTSWAAGTGTIDAARGSSSWVAAGIPASDANSTTFTGVAGETPATWAGRTWAGRTWAGSSWFLSPAGRTWAGRTWASHLWS